MSMTGRERLDAALNHRQPDRIPVDFNGTAVTGMHVKCVIGLREHYGLEKRLVKVHEPYQMLGWIDDDLQTALGIDVEGVYGPDTMFGYRNENWKPWRMDDGTEVLMSGNFRTTKDENGDTLVYPKGDRSAPPSGRLPKNGFFFDTIIRQEPIDEDKLDPADNLEEFGPISEAALDHFERESRRPGRPAGASSPASAGPPSATSPSSPPRACQAPQGHPGRRGVVRLDPDPPPLRSQGLRRADRDRPSRTSARSSPGSANQVQAVFICGTDFGTQQSTFCSVAAFRELYLPYYRRDQRLDPRPHGLEDLQALLRRRRPAHPGLHRERLRHPQSRPGLGRGHGRPRAEGGVRPGHRVLGRRRRHPEDPGLRDAGGGPGRGPASAARSSAAAAASSSTPSTTSRPTSPIANIVAMFEAVNEHNGRS